MLLLLLLFFTSLFFSYFHKCKRTWLAWPNSGNKHNMLMTIMIWEKESTMKAKKKNNEKKGLIHGNNNNKNNNNNSIYKHLFFFCYYYCCCCKLNRVLQHVPRNKQNPSRENVIYIRVCTYTWKKRTNEKKPEILFQTNTHIHTLKHNNCIVNVMVSLFRFVMLINKELIRPLNRFMLMTSVNTFTYACTIHTYTIIYNAYLASIYENF